MPVCRIERKANGNDKPGPITRQLMEAMEKLVRS
jgi:branched-subunit amino acid aminotransferase/4-amino-4-deoxychorismate lyase